MSNVLVTGGTGNLGKSLVRILDENNIDYQIGSRSNKSGAGNIAVMDLVANTGVRDAVKGKKIIFHLATDLKQEVVVTQNLLNAIDANSDVHLIYISIVGVDVIPFGYYKQKLASENAIKKSGIPYAILRATQFHEFIHQIFSQLLKFKIGFLPKKIVAQPIQTEVVAQALFALSQISAANETHEIGGAAISTFEEMAAQWMAHYGKRRIIINLPIWGKLGKTFRNGSLTTANSKPESISWRAWLEQKK